MFHPDFYHVAYSNCGCHDNRMDKIWWNEQWMGWPIGPHYAEQSNVTQAHRIAREEIFGPVLSVLTFRTPAEAVEKANNTPYGLSAGVWTEKGSRILWMAERLRAGVVWANTFNQFDPASPFGGVRESGFGREGGRQGLTEYLSLEPAGA